MTNIPANFPFQEREAHWRKYWAEHKIFKSVPDHRESYTVVIPPPNVTGVLHMGHMLNNTIQDVMVRRARLKGYNACWVPGTDHASIATEAKVVAKLKAEGITKFSLSRNQFLEHAWDWTRKHGGLIQEQLKMLGASCDWDREAFTLDETRSASVKKVFVDLYEKGLIYRGYRMVNWDPEAKTNISDEEVNHKEVQAKLYFLRYEVMGASEPMRIATTRPETILGDVALCVNPEDERYKHLVGKTAIVPIVNRKVPIIADAYVDSEFGTGCLKITPAHDINDKTIGDKHQLEIIDVLNEDGTLNEHGLHYEGQDRFAVRKAIAKELAEKGYLEKTEDYTTTVGTSERTGAVIEPRLSVQWFLKMKELAQPALQAVMEDEVALIPAKFKNTYRHWMENVHDWNISRQLWWGHQIPAWYFGKGSDDFVVAFNESEALTKARQKSGNPKLEGSHLKQDPDVLDTWFSSWLWPISVFDGVRKPENPEIQYYYPTRDLVTAPDILFFWVARMIMAGYALRGEKPFDKVYLTGMVRDKQGRKMSKSLGNSPDPIKLMEKYSVDAVRAGMLFTSPAGNDLPFDEDLCQQGRNFTNKIWNALRLIKGWDTTAAPADAAAQEAGTWFAERRQQVLQELEKSFAQYRISEALMQVYKFIWDDYCSWYLEAIKPGYQQPINAEVREQALRYFEELMVLLHPFMPFVSEEVWQLIATRKEGASVGTQSWPALQAPEAKTLADFAQAQAIINSLRNVRAKQNIAPKELLTLQISAAEAVPKQLEPLIVKLGYLEAVEPRPQEAGSEPGFNFMAGKYSFFVPAGDLIDPAAEREKMLKELDYQRGFLEKVRQKLSNERFVQNAPEAVVAAEKKKESDAEAKIKALEAGLEDN